MLSQSEKTSLRFLLGAVGFEDLFSFLLQSYKIKNRKSIMQKEKILKERTKQTISGPEV